MFHFRDRILKKAMQSDCRYKVVALGFNRKGDFIGMSMNKHRLNRYGCSYHAEVELIKKYKGCLKTIIVCKANKQGEITKIDPCDTCSKLADKYGITIKTIEGGL